MIRLRQVTIKLLLRLFIFTNFTICHLLAGAIPRPHSIHKRNIFQLCNLVYVHTNRGCYNYYSYGCFCGLGNAESQTLDATDDCCRIHDQCYGDLSCFWFYFPQLVTYNFECAGDTCECTDSTFYSPCSYEICQCDLQFAQCLRNASFNHEFSGYSWQNCE